MKKIIEMAREAGLPEIIDNANIPWAELSIFAVFIRADEREACAKVVDAIEAQCIADDVDDPPLAHVAAAIRARGNQ